MTGAELSDEALRLSASIDHALQSLRDYTEQTATAERDYRRGKAEAWVRCPTGGEWTAARREAWVDADTADLRYQRDLADGLQRGALESLRSRRAQLSALQSLLAADRAEAEVARTGVQP